MDEVKHPRNNAVGQINLSLVRNCLQQGDAKLALQYCHELLTEDPQHVQTFLFAALAARSLGWFDNALDFINKALVIAPKQPTIQSMMGDILLLQKRPGPALTALLEAQQLGDCSAQTNFSIGSAYLALGVYQDAKIYFDKALSMDPKMVAAHVNKGLAEHSLMNLDVALDCFDAALSIDPCNIDAKWNKPHVLLTLGKYEEGFKLYENRWKHPKIQLKKRKFNSRLWLGQENLSGKTILLYAEGGFGDTIQFIRYAKLFDADVKLIIQCQVPLMELISLMGIAAQIISPGDEPPQHDFHCPLMSLPLAFGTTIDTVPHFDKYIHAPDQHLKKWDAFMGRITGSKIGVMVRGSGSSEVDKRSIELQKLERYLPTDAGFVLLQKDLIKSEKRFVQSRVNWLAPCADFSETAAICELLDVVISVDTSVAHLAAAMGKPTLLLLPFRPDWRWGEKGENTVWYWSCTLLRQPQYDDWESVFKSISPNIVKIIR